MDNIIDRSECVICEDSKLSHICFYTWYNNNQNYKLNIGKCGICGSAQIMDLINPDFLYKDYIQPLSTSISWIQHNVHLVKFIIDHIDLKQPLIEIGASSFVIGKHLVSYYTDYTVFDYSFSENVKRYDNVKYIEGNCEQYNFDSNSTIIMSHVFEHLYKPRMFLQNCMNNKVDQIVISIPNMNDNNLNHLTILHTFLYSSNDIEYLFNTYKYKLVTKETIDIKFSTVYFFKYDDTIVPTSRIINPNRFLATQNALSTSVIIPPNTFIATAGDMSYILYSRIQNKENILGVLDNNIIRIGSQFNDTNIIVQPFNVLNEYKSNINIVIPEMFKHSTSEIGSSIINNHPHVNIIYL